MRGVVGAALGHVARDAIGRRGRHARGMRGGVTLQANAGIVAERLFAARNPVRIVARGAFQLPAAFQKTARLAQPVDRADRLEFALVPGTGRVVEGDREIPQWLSRHIGERAAVESLQHRRNASAGGFQVALHAHFHAPLGTQLGRIHHRRPRPAGAHMFGSRTVASLAIDPLRQFAEEHRIAARFLVGGRDVRVAVVAEHALVGDEPAGLRMLACRTREPCAIPRRGRDTSQGAVRSACPRGPVQIRAGMISRAHHIVDAQFFHVDLFAARVQLPAPLEILAVSDGHGVVAVGKGMVIAGSFPRSLQWCWRRRAERTTGPFRCAHSWPRFRGGRWRRLSNPHIRCLAPPGPVNPPTALRRTGEETPSDIDSTPLPGSGRLKVGSGDCGSNRRKRLLFYRKAIDSAF